MQATYNELISRIHRESMQSHELTRQMIKDLGKPGHN